MKILIIGATGFIGKHIYQGLKDAKYEVEASCREFIDFTTLQDDKELVNKLQSFEIVINAVGIIAETKSQTFEQMHTLAPIVLFNACKETEVKKVIHISALGTQTGTTDYHMSKNRADEYLRASGLEYAILHVYTLLLRALSPYHWLHPFGSVLKNLPLVISIYILSRLERFR